MNGAEVVGSPVWELVYQHCWKKWMIGLDLLRKAGNGVEAARGKEMMSSAEDMLRMPLRQNSVSWDSGQKVAYSNKLERESEKNCLNEFNKGGVPENKKE